MSTTAAGADPETWLAARLADVTPPGGPRRRERLHPVGGAWVRTADGYRLLNFAGNDYLGLATHPAVVQAAQQALQQYGTGSGASQLMSGYREVHHQLEQELCRFTGRPACALFASGYQANLAVLPALVGPGALLCMDQRVHASLVDAALLSRARVVRFRHLDLADLARKLEIGPVGRRRVVVTEGVFSMEGDSPSMEALARLCHQHDAMLVVDDAHGFGVLGEHGGGITAALDSSQVPVLIGTFGKALGAAGAFVAGSSTLIALLEQCARTLIYTTALPPVLAAAALAALTQLRRADGPRARLARNIAAWRRLAQQQGLVLQDSETPIQPFPVVASEQACLLSQALRERGLLVPAMRPPTVPEGASRLRISLSALHDTADLRQLAEALAACT